MRNLNRNMSVIRLDLKKELLRSVDNFIYYKSIKQGNYGFI